MKPQRSHCKTTALTLIEVMVVIAVLAVLMLLFFPWPEPIAKPKPWKIICVNNLKQVGIAYRIWEVDHNDKYPMQVSVINGGSMEFARAGDVASTFLVMSNELSVPKILVCLADSNRIAAVSFSHGLNNSNISYFVGLDASDELPQAVISGDDNFVIGGVPVRPGLLELTTNAPVTWTTGRHNLSGTIGFADGSVQQLSNSGLTNLLQQTGFATNRFAIP
jgi:prepilin-type N-terminal cleavage/methylation domain-containing protein/prepilin-type processing-associated H-X9-DG protein